MTHTAKYITTGLLVTIHSSAAAQIIPPTTKCYDSCSHLMEMEMIGKAALISYIRADIFFPIWM